MSKQAGKFLPKYTEHINNKRKQCMYWTQVSQNLLFKYESTARSSDREINEFCVDALKI